MVSRQLPNLFIKHHLGCRKGLKTFLKCAKSVSSNLGYYKHDLPVGWVERRTPKP